MRYIVSVIAILMLQGCGTRTPPCADEKTVNTVKEIFRKSLEEQTSLRAQNKSISDQVMAAIQINITTIRTAEHDEKIGKFTCDAVMEVAVPDNIAKAISDPMFRRIMSSDPTTQTIGVSDKALTNDIHYTSQLTDDKHEHLVELKGHKPIVNLVLILGANGAFNQQPQPSATPDKLPSEVLPKAELEGEWTRLGSTPSDASSLTITNVNTSGFSFNLSVYSGTHTGEIEGLAKNTTGEAVYKDEESSCEVKYTGKSGHIFVSTSEECSSMGGGGVTFSGEYVKGLEPKAPTLIELGVLASNITENDFTELVGKDYELFMSSFQMRSDNDDLDGLGAKVVSGAMRGGYGSVEAIVMSRPDGKIIAAVIDGNVVKYFSTDPAFKDKLPITIDKWRKNFTDKKVIFVNTN